MGVTAKLAGFAVILIATFGAAFGVGRAIGPVGDDSSPVPVTDTTTTSTTVPGHGGHS